MPATAKLAIFSGFCLQEIKIHCPYNFSYKAPSWRNRVERTDRRLMFILWYVDSLIGNDRDIGSYTQPLLGNGRNRRARNNGEIVGDRIFSAVRFESI
jgi:hypothetical protein